MSAAHVHACSAEQCSAVQGRAEQGSAGQGRTGQGRAGQCRAGQGRTGRGGAGRCSAGQGRAGQGGAGQCSAGQGRAKQGRAGQGRAGILWVQPLLAVEPLAKQRCRHQFVTTALKLTSVSLGIDQSILILHLTSEAGRQSLWSVTCVTELQVMCWTSNECDHTAYA